MNKRTISIALLVLLVIAGVIAWAMVQQGESAEFLEVRALQEKLLNDESLTESQRNSGWREVKQKWSTLSAHEQSLLMSQHEQKERQQIDRFFALQTEEERNAYLDNVLDQWEAKASEKRKSARDKAANNSKKKDGAKNAAKGKVHDPESERAGLRAFLDSSTADERARKRIYHTELKQRWAERHGDAFGKK